MAGLDWIVLAIVVLSCVVGAMRGVIQEVFSLGAWAAGVFAAWMYGEFVIQLLGNVIENPSLRALAGYALAFLSAFMLITLAAYLLRTMMKKVGLSGLDRGMGVLFGAMRAGVVVIVLGVLAGLSKVGGQAWWKDAIAAPVVQTAVLAVKPFLPPSVAGRISFSNADIGSMRFVSTQSPPPSSSRAGEGNSSVVNAQNPHEIETGFPSSAGRSQGWGESHQTIPVASIQPRPPSLTQGENLALPTAQIAAQRKFT